MSKRASKARIIYTVNKYCVHSHKKLENALKTYKRLEKRSMVEGDTPYLHAELGKALAKCKKYGIEVGSPKE